ncbi:hypothetical protein, partial [Escherichia coli]|uniref:restriction endonuclease n=1 Tax=Escherichia coli TaxID=562 RepID=UPI003075CF30
NWTEEAKNMLRDKAVPVTALSLTDLEQSALDWSQFDFDPAYKPVMKCLSGLDSIRKLPEKTQRSD